MATLHFLPRKSFSPQTTFLHINRKSRGERELFKCLVRLHHQNLVLVSYVFIIENLIFLFRFMWYCCSFEGLRPKGMWWRRNFGWERRESTDTWQVSSLLAIIFYAIIEISRLSLPPPPHIFCLKHICWIYISKTNSC